MKNTTNDTEIKIEHLESARESIRATIESIKRQMLDLSARLREKQIEERDISIRLINAHYADAPQPDIARGGGIGDEIHARSL